ncbi:Lactate racemase [Methanimicrococcus stummii]|uniref:Lactate racemase n=1 Tax=Methanimicrococcus stummii TaxID=3028294 RepID=A0AA96VHA2_9EURY|nr:nickel-dependent lactate racemase [Methanimicrococcus sp. Es2]WNY28231.1 Lactate racemase [Methanimicrococcus sp. Es2]
MTNQNLSVPYGSGALSFEIPESAFLGLVLPANEGESESEIDSDALIRNALKNPIGSKRLSEIAVPNQKIAVIVNDITRPTPSAYLIPFVLEELAAAGVPDENITFYFALGLHRAHTDDEIQKLLGSDIYNRFKFVQHEVGTFPTTAFGKTSRGTPIEIYSDIPENDLIVGIGEVGFHYYAGYSGGAKSLLPGVSSKDSVITNHKMMIEKNAVSGRVDSPVRQDLEEAAGIIGLDFILNVVLDSHKKVVAAASGNYIDAHRECVKVVDAMYKISVEPADAVIVSCGGYPKDINLYQTNKALDNATQAVKEGGAIIVVSECRDGIGNEVYCKWNQECKTAADAIARFAEEFEFGGHKAATTAAASQRFDLHLVSGLSDEAAEEAFFIPATTVEEAISKVLSKNPDAKFHVIPYGGQTLPVMKS